MFLVTGDAGTYYPEMKSEPGHFSRDGARAIQNFAGFASLPVTLDIQNRIKLDNSLCGRKQKKCYRKIVV